MTRVECPHCGGELAVTLTAASPRRRSAPPTSHRPSTLPNRSERQPSMPPPDDDGREGQDEEQEDARVDAAPKEDDFVVSANPGDVVMLVKRDESVPDFAFRAAETIARLRKQGRTNMHWDMAEWVKSHSAMSRDRGNLTHPSWSRVLRELGKAAST